MESLQRVAERCDPWAVELVDCVEESDDYSFSGKPYGWVLAHPWPLRKPIQVRGNQGLWTVPPDIARRLR